jgi:hypothetical protein
MQGLGRKCLGTSFEVSSSSFHARHKHIFFEYLLVTHSWQLGLSIPRGRVDSEPEKHQWTIPLRSDDHELALIPDNYLLVYNTYCCVQPKISTSRVTT